MAVQAGELLRRGAWETLDTLKGGKGQKLLKVNKREIVEGVTPAYQERRLNALLSYAVETCPYYRNLPQMPQPGRPGTTVALSDALGMYRAEEVLKAFPVQTKRDFLDHYDDVLSDRVRDVRDRLHRFSTSGSTGTPFTVLADDDKQLRVNMNFMSVMELNGFRLGMKRGEFRAWIEGKNTISDFRSFTNNLLMIDISNMGDDAVRAIFERIFAERIQVLVAYSSAVTALVDYAERSSLDVSGWSVEMIFTMGEALPEETRKKCEELFGIRPVLSYGNNENGFIAVSLPSDPDEYTIDLYNFYVEILKMDSDDPAEEGEAGRIVVTDYYNRAFPMIRYDTGDTGVMRTLPAKDGRVKKALTEIYGRRGALIRNTKGEPLSIHVFMNNLLNFEGRIRQAKCIQTGLKQYVLQLNPEMGAHVDEQHVVDTYKSYLGDDAEVSVEYVDALPVEQSGKTMVTEQRAPEYQ